MNALDSTQGMPTNYSTAHARKILSEILDRAFRWEVITIEHHWTPKWAFVSPEIWELIKRMNALTKLWISKESAKVAIITLAQFIDIYPWEKVSLLDLLNHIVDRVAFFISEEPKN